MTTFIRVKDPDTGHEFDLPEQHPWITSGEVKPLNSDRWPPSEAARPPKHHVKPASIRAPKPAASVEASSTAEKE